MASAWGNAWSVYFGNSWGSITQQPASGGIGGGDYRHPGVTREMLRKHFKDILKAIEPEYVPQEIKVAVKKALSKTKEMVVSDDLSTEKAEEARFEVEQAWMKLQAQKIELETKLPLLEIKWLLTLQYELSILYSVIDDEEEALVLLMSY